MTFDNFSKVDVLFDSIKTHGHSLPNFGIRDNQDIPTFHFSNPVALVTETLDLDLTCVPFRNRWFLWEITTLYR